MPDLRPSGKAPSSDVGQNRLVNLADPRRIDFDGIESVRQRNREVQALGLPERLLRKLFYENAARLLPEIVPA